MRKLSAIKARLTGDDQFSQVQPVFDVLGSIDIADDVIFAVGPLPTEVVVAHSGVCTIGERVYIGFGSSISCDRSVRIGAGTRVGASSMIYDSDFHRAGSHDARLTDAEALPPKTGPVDIGNDVLIGQGVIILRGTTIGDAAVIEAGSVVWGTIGPGERVSANQRT